jgi:tetratricopeptide (TPR) repeat protein
MDSTETTRNEFRFTIGQVMTVIAGSAVVLGALVVKGNVVLPMLAFLVLCRFLLFVLIAAMPSLGRLLFGYRGEVPLEWVDVARTRESFRAALRLCHEGRSLEALEVLEPLQVVWPADAAVALAQAWCYRQLGRHDEAVRVLERVELANAHEPLIHYALACARSAAGNVPLALDSLSLAIELEPALRDSIAEEPDFEAIRGEEDYARLVNVAEPTG